MCHARDVGQPRLVHTPQQFHRVAGPGPAHSCVSARGVHVRCRDVHPGEGGGGRSAGHAAAEGQVSGGQLAGRPTSRAPGRAPSGMAQPGPGVRQAGAHALPAACCCRPAAACAPGSPGSRPPGARRKTARSSGHCHELKPCPSHGRTRPGAVGCLAAAAAHPRLGQHHKLCQAVPAPPISRGGVHLCAAGHAGRLWPCCHSAGQCRWKWLTCAWGRPAWCVARFASERRKAKILNFSIAYGKTAHGLAKDFGTTLQEAEDTVAKSVHTDWRVTG